MTGTARGGNDHPVGGAAWYDTLYGDADLLWWGSQGGNDRLTGGEGADTFVFQGDGLNGDDGRARSRVRQ